VSSRAHWLRSALTDEHGQFDIAYIGMGALIVIVLGAIPSLLLMAVWALYAGRAFDPQPLGIAIGAVCGGFAAALGSLAGYMAATRPTRPATAPVAAVTVNAQGGQP
jgi:hypothetical protein